MTLFFLGESTAYVAQGASTAGIADNSSQTIGSFTYKYAAGKPTGVVSIGDTGKERRLQNMAAGYISATSTDAVNGSQLYATNSVLSNLGDSVVKSLGGDTTINNAGNITPNIQVNGNQYNNVNEAISYAASGWQLVSRLNGNSSEPFVIKPGDQFVVDSGLNIEVTQDNNKLTIATSNNPKFESVTAAETGKDGQTVMNSTGITTKEGDKTTNVHAGNVELTDGNLTTNVGSNGITIASNTGDGSSTVSLTHEGLNNGGNKITHVADGKDLTDAVNVSQLKEVEALAGKHTKVTVNQVAPVAGKDAFGAYTDGNLQIAEKVVDGQSTYDLKLSDNLVLGGKDGKDGVNGSIGVNGADGKSGVGIDGKDGISVKGADGKDGVTIKGKDGKDGTEGHIGLTGPAGKDGEQVTADIHVKEGQPGVDGKDGITRIVYEDKGGTTHEVATLDDGMKYDGDFGKTLSMKLNSTVNVKGNAAKEADLVDGNIGVVANGKDQLTVKLNKDLKNMNSFSGNGQTISFTTGGISVGPTGGKQVVFNGTTVNVGGQKITNLAAGEDDTDAVNVSQLKDYTNKVVEGGFGITAEDGKSVTKKLGEKVDVVGDGKNITTAVTEDGKVKVALKDDIKVNSVTTEKDGKSTVMNSDGVTTKDGDKTTEVTAEGVTTKDGDKITNVTADGMTTTDGKNTTTVNAGGITIAPSTGDPSKNVTLTNNGLNNGGNTITNVAAGVNDTDAVNVSQLKDYTSKAVEGGFGITAEDGSSVTKKLGEKVDVVGDGKNISTAVKDGKVEVSMKDDINVNSVTAGKDGNTTVVNENGVVINHSNGDQNSVSLTGNGLNNGGNKITNVADGEISADSKDAVNGSQIYDLLGKSKTGVTVNGGTEAPEAGANGELGEYAGLEEGNLGIAQKVNNGVVSYDIKMSSNLKNMDSISGHNNNIIFNDGGVSITGQGGKSVVFTGDGVDMGGQRITNLAPGINGTDAVNVDQLRGLEQNIYNNADDIKNVGALSAGLAALKPIQYDPLEPTQIMVGAGHYKGKEAFALGLAHYTNESSMYHIGFSVNGKDTMANIGATWKFGHRAAANAVPDRYNNGPISSAYTMHDEISAIKAENKYLKEELSDVRQELKQYVEELQALRNEMKAMRS